MSTKPGQRNASEPMPRFSIFDDRRRSQERRRRNDMRLIPNGGCRRKERRDRRSNANFQSRHWWLHTNYLDEKER